jgi:hypothetical protein
MNCSYSTPCSRTPCFRHDNDPQFFQLRTGLAGEILQKFTNYRFVVAIVGDFDVYDSKSLRDFIYECNQGKQVFFAKDQQSALDRLRNR